MAKYAIVVVNEKNLGNSIGHKSPKMIISVLFSCVWVSTSHVYIEI